MSSKANLNASLPPAPCIHNDENTAAGDLRLGQRENMRMGRAEPRRVPSTAMAGNLLDIELSPRAMQESRRVLVAALASFRNVPSTLGLVQALDTSRRC